MEDIGVLPGGDFCLLGLLCLLVFIDRLGFGIRAFQALHTSPRLIDRLGSGIWAFQALHTSPRLIDRLGSGQEKRGVNNPGETDGSPGS